MARFRVATFNVHHCRGLDGRVDIARVARVIDDAHADLIALQELDRRMPRSEEMDQPAELERLTGMRITFGGTLERSGGEYGIAIGSRSGGGPFRFGSLPQLADEEPRGYLMGPWQGITVIATHLSLQRGPRDEQTDALMQLANGLRGPCLLLGDFNQSAWALRRAARGVVRVPVLPRRTMATRWAQRDHIVGAGGVEVQRRHVISTHASDHYALAADITTP